MPRRHRNRTALSIYGSIAVLALCGGCGTHGTDKETPQAARPGVIVINPQFGGAGKFSEGLAPVRVGDDKTGKWG
jgi:hypothetical protein